MEEGLVSCAFMPFLCYLASKKSELLKMWERSDQALKSVLLLSFLDHVRFHLEGNPVFDRFCRLVRSQVVVGR